MFSSRWFFQFLYFFVILVDIYLLFTFVNSDNNNNNNHQSRLNSLDHGNFYVWCQLYTRMCVHLCFSHTPSQRKKKKKKNYDHNYIYYRFSSRANHSEIYENSRWKTMHTTNMMNTLNFRLTRVKTKKTKNFGEEKTEDDEKKRENARWWITCEHKHMHTRFPALKIWLFIRCINSD